MPIACWIAAALLGSIFALQASRRRGAARRKKTACSRRASSMVAATSRSSGISSGTSVRAKASGSLLTRMATSAVFNSRPDRGQPLPPEQASPIRSIPTPLAEMSPGGLLTFPTRAARQAGQFVGTAGDGDGP